MNSEATAGLKHNFRPVLWILALCFTTACDRIDHISPGPVPLEGKAHFETYLGGHQAWQSWQDAEELQLFWSFDEEGSFSAWIEDTEKDGLAAMYPEVFPAGTNRASGQWVLAGEEVPFRIKLTEMVTDAGQSLPPAEIEVGWVDGKLRLEIGPVHFMTYSL